MSRGKTTRKIGLPPEALKWLGAALGLCLVLVLSVQLYRALNRPGELVFDRDSADVGQLALGQPVVYRFPMRNAGAKPVTITRKSASAVEGC